MDEADEIHSILETLPNGSASIAPITLQRLKLLTRFCPVYKDALRCRPELVLWLEEPECDRQLYRPGDYSLMRAHPLFTPADQSAEQRKSSLRVFRRAMSLRIAYRELSNLSDIERSMKELSALAQYVLGDALSIVQEPLEEKMGQPWDDTYKRTGRFCILALGKMGGTELNFVSDLDLIYAYEGSGYCRKNGRETSFSNEQFFAKLSRELTSILQERSADGFLYNIDLRLRPEGDGGPIARSLSGMERYYYESGQTWERMAMMKARPVAGDMNLGGELMESLSSFRFPRNPPPALFEEIAGLKLRIEHEVLGEENFILNIKNGWGGIREIEFIIQALQMVYQNRYPFLQTQSTLDALQGLERYEILGHDEVLFLRESYLWLRRVEHRLQMREEERTQTLPRSGPAREQLAKTLDLSEQEFDAKMDEIRAKVRSMYESYFPMSTSESLVQEWTEFISGKKPGPQIDALLNSVFWGPREPIEKGIRHLAIGNAPVRVVTRETVQLMIELGNTFPHALAPQAHPLRTLGRVNEYADRYGARKSFLRLCATNAQFFKALCMIFDRSSFIHSLVCAHPEILEELMLVSALRLNKPGRIMRAQVRALEKDSDEATAKALWLWIKAEQVRIAMAQVLSEVGLPRVELALSRVGSVVVSEMLRRVDPEGELIAVALGKFGGRELSFGSDLDMMLVCREASDERMINKAIRLKKLLGYKGPLGPGFEIDMRLRPHGEDGPLVVALPALLKYHRGQGGQQWEKQALLRSRPIADRSETRGRRDDTAEAYIQMRREIIFGETTGDKNSILAEIRRMRAKIETEKAKARPPQRSFKAGPGGLLDVEFSVQALQMLHGGTRPQICSQNTRDALKLLHSAEIISTQDYSSLKDNYEFLRTLEFRLRREHNTPISSIEADSDLEHSIAKWMSFEDFPSLMKELTERMARTRSLYDKLTNAQN
ncbi:MAG: hypothetical protein JW942_01840 [Opitutales bacterium]|nr:hypothetical protein [Opitutales bacterium]